MKKEFKDVGMFIDLAGQIKKAGNAVGEVDEEVLGLRIDDREGGQASDRVTAEA